jgi:cytochrome c oxidase subunit 1
VVSEILAVHARRGFGYWPTVAAMFGTAGLGLVAWGQHLVVAGESPKAAAIFSVLALLAIVPASVLVLSWLATLWRGSIALSVPMLYALGFVALFTVSACPGSSWRCSPGRAPVLHLLRGRAPALPGGGRRGDGLPGGAAPLVAKITGRTTSEALGAGLALVMLGVNATFFVHFVLGSRGMVRRHYVYDEGLRLLQGFSTVGTWILGAGLLLTSASSSGRCAPGAGRKPTPGAGRRWSGAPRRRPCLRTSRRSRSWPTGPTTSRRRWVREARPGRSPPRPRPHDLQAHRVGREVA